MFQIFFFCLNAIGLFLKGQRHKIFEIFIFCLNAIGLFQKGQRHKNFEIFIFCLHAIGLLFHKLKLILHFLLGNASCCCCYYFIPGVVDIDTVFKANMTRIIPGSKEKSLRFRYDETG